MDIKGTEDKLNQVDSLLTTLTKVLKKHWLILILIGVSAFVYFSWDSFATDQVDEDVQTEQVENQQDVEQQVDQPIDDTTTTYDENVDENTPPE